VTLFISYKHLKTMAAAIKAFDGVVAASFLVALYLLTRSVYRLYFHPLANVPGPKLAALTSWHEGWYDCFENGGGQHAFKMREMHDIYGKYTSILSHIITWEIGLICDEVPSFVSTLGKSI
jgi:hypothetical protein